MNVVIFGPNGSGKGTQCEWMERAYSLRHIESGELLRSHFQKRTAHGKTACAMERGELVSDALTVSMIWGTLRDIRSEGWLLDGFPRSIGQAESLLKLLRKYGKPIDCIVELVLDREAAKNRITGRRICTQSSDHPNNLHIDAILPNGDCCRVCGARLKTRTDDKAEGAVNKRLDIYYDRTTGTLAARDYLLWNSPAKHIEIDVGKTIEDVKNELSSRIHTILCT